MSDKTAVSNNIVLAHSAFTQWRLLSVKERGEFVFKLSAEIDKHKKTLSGEITRQMGKKPVEADREIERCIKVCREMPGLAETALADEIIPTEHGKSYVTYQPLGVILGITPWNFPLWQAIRFVVPNILAGNTTLVKPAPNVFTTGELLQNLFADAGIDEGVFQSLSIDESMVPEIIEHPAIQGVSLTGSVAAGRAVAAMAGKALKKSVLELGGSDPFIVLEGANINEAVEKAYQARFMNAGQICVAAKRILVQESIADSFIDKLTKKIRNQISGPAPELARKDLCDLLEKQIEESINMGAKILLGGNRSSETRFQATVLDEVRSDMPVWKQEVFGPACCITRFKNEEEAIRLANSSDFGLGATIWTNNIKQGEKMALNIDSGMVYINSLLRSDIRLPFGGIKNSGYGRELGKEGFREFTNCKTIVVNPA